MRTHSIDSVDFNVLLHLYGHRNEQPCAAGDVATAVRARPQLVYASLNRLSKQELVQHEATGEPRGYSLTEKGMSHLLKVSANEQWKTGGLISGKAAVYRLEPRPLKRGRVRVFSAKVHSTTDNRGPLHGKATVIIKTLDPDTHRGPFLHLFAQEVAGQLQLTNDVVEAELPSLHRLREIDSAAATLDSGSKSLLIRTPEGFISAAQHFIVQEYLNAQSLEDYLTERYVGPGQRRFSGIDSTGEWFELASQLAEHLKAVHDAGDFHRAISPSTIFVVTDSSGKPRFVCVDLGEAAFGALPPLPLERDSEDATDDDSESDRDASAAHNLDAIDYVAPEQRGRIFPSRAADLFSVGAVLYFALTGQAPAFAGIANHETLKSLIQQDLLRRSRSLFVRNTGIADIVSRCLRTQPETRVPSAYALMQDIRVFSRLHHDATDSVSIRRLTDELYDLTRDSSVDVFGSLASFEAREFMQVLRHLRRGSITVAGDHDQIVWRLCAYLSTLGKGDSYCTVTVPAFWRPENVGVRGRYLSMNLEVVRYGATIRRLFLLTPHDRDIAEVRDVVKAHIELQRQFDAIKTHDWTGSLETRFLLMREDDRRREIASGCHHGLWLRAGSAVSLIPQYDIDGRVISVHVTRLKGERQSLEESFMKRFELGKPLEAWATGPADDAQLSRRPGS